MKFTFTVLAAAVQMSAIAGQNPRPTGGRGAAAARWCPQMKTRLTQACTTGYMGDCSARCAEVFLPYYRTCAASEPSLQSQSSFNAKCTATLNVDSRPLNGRSDCATDTTLPVMLACADWTGEALADGQISEQDDFCRSNCHEGLEKLVGCQGQMSEAIQQSLAVLTPMVGKCQQALHPPQRGDQAGAPECHIDAVEEQCGPPGGQDDLCTDACLAIMKRTWDACTDGVGRGDDMFAEYSDKIDACDDKSQDDACDKTAGESLQWVSSNCCDGAPRSLLRTARTGARTVVDTPRGGCRGRRRRLRRTAEAVHPRVCQHFHAVLQPLRQDHLRRR
jgi:hypothetical protein